MFGGETQSRSAGDRGPTAVRVCGRRPARAVSSVAAIQQQHRRARHGHDGRRDDAIGDARSFRRSNPRDVCCRQFPAATSRRSRRRAREARFPRRPGTLRNRNNGDADVVLPASSYAEQDGTFTNNDGLVQRVRQSIPPVHQSKPDWMIIAQLAKELGMDFGFELSPSAVFREHRRASAGLFRHALSVIERRNKSDSGEVPRRAKLMLAKSWRLFAAASKHSANTARRYTEHQKSGTSCSGLET